MHKTMVLLVAICVPLMGAITREERLQGCLLSAMLGDCLGRVTEFKKNLDTIFQCYLQGVQGPESFVERDWVGVPAIFKQNKIMPYTDDSRMAILVLKGIVGLVEDADGKIWSRSILINSDLSGDMTSIALQFIDDGKDTLFGWAAPYRAPGKACCAGVKKLSERFNGWLADNFNTGSSQYQGDTFSKNRLWDVEAVNAGGCGSVMRAYPCGMVFADQPETAITYAVAQSRLTHGHPIALAASAGIAAGVAAAIRGETVESVVNAIINAAALYDAKTAEKVRQAVTLARANKPSLDSCGSALNAFKSKQFRDEHERIFIRFPGWAADDALAGAVYCFCMSPESIINAIHLGVHTSGDSDSIASLAGALVGAHCGINQIKHYVSLIEDGEVAMRYAHAVFVMQQKA
jgi:ADP-ribosylglycohydrolase